MVLVQKELKNAYIWIPFPTSIVLDKSSINLTNIWDTAQLTATIEPTISDHSITWTTSDPTVATVSTTWLVTCVTPWECTITATTVNGLTASCSVDDNQWWQPWANTIVYYPFTSQTTVADMSGNSYNLTNNWATFWTFQGVDCVYVDWTTYLECPTAVTVPDWCTILAWCYTQNTSWDFRRIVNIAAGNRSLMLTYSTGNEWKWYNVWLWWRPTTNATSYYGAWYLVAWTWLSNVQKLYIYWANTAVDITDNQNTYWMTNATLCVGADSSSHWDNFIGGVSNLIIESRVRTAQEVVDYYNQTKSLYGIS